MSNLTLVLDRKELVVRMDARTIRVDRPDASVERIPLNMVGRVVIVGSPMISCDVWRALASQDIPAVILPLRGNGAAAFVGAGLTSSANHRIRQHLAYHADDCSTRIGRWLLDKKISGQINVIRKIGNGSGVLPDFLQTMQSCRSDLIKASNRSSLMGYEGTAASSYFKALAALLPKKWQFSGRNRRPPKDPVNALLSLGYKMAESDVISAILEKGLDPAISFVHAIESGRENLMLDILEPLRPIVDGFVLQLLKSKLNLKSFTSNNQDGCLLNKEGRSRFYKAWAIWQSEAERERAIKPMAQELIGKLVDFFPPLRLGVNR